MHLDDRDFVWIHHGALQSTAEEVSQRGREEYSDGFAVLVLQDPCIGNKIRFWCP
jgi:hypothetical protein